jgi:hypothetical protein
VSKNRNIFVDQLFTSKFCNKKDQKIWPKIVIQHPDQTKNNLQLQVDCTKQTVNIKKPDWFGIQITRMCPKAEWSVFDTGWL